jgi:uncharacterized protein (DUF1501 family)
VVARLVDAGLRDERHRRQVFFVSLGGFDTHDLQNRNHADLMARMGQALTYFDNTLGALGARGQVTTSRRAISVARSRAMATARTTAGAATTS